VAFLNNVMENKSDIQIILKKLSSKEIDILIGEAKNFPYLVAGDRKRWTSFSKAYVMYKENQLVASCSVIELEKYIKLGPFIVLEKHQGKRYASLLVSEIIRKNKHVSIYIGSYTPAIWHLAEKYSFKRIKSFFILPNVIRKYIIIQSLKNSRMSFMTEYLKKRIYKNSDYRYYVLEHNQVCNSLISNKQTKRFLFTESGCFFN